MDEAEYKRQPDSRTDDIFVTFVRAHESAHHESQSANERGISRKTERTQIKVHEQPPECIMDKQIQIETEGIGKQRENDQAGGIERLIKNIGIHVLARLNRRVPG